MDRILTLRIGAGATRLDKALAASVPEEESLSRSRLARLIADGAVRLDGQIVTQGSVRVTEGAQVKIALPAVADVDIEAEEIPLDIVYEDDDLVVVNKPAGLVVHPAPGSPSGTLVNGLLHHFGGSLSGIGGEKRPGIVHRIDKDTSGLLVVAKSDRAHQGLAAQFEAHSVERRYLALCHGVPSPADPRLRGQRGVSFEGQIVKITTGLARHRTDRQRQAVYFDGGRHAVTRVATVADYGSLSLVSARLETGRTHQIRVHMAHIGHALVGDQTYGGRRLVSAKTYGADLADRINLFPRQALHAETLGFIHPAHDERLTFAAPLPDDVSELLSLLRAIAPDASGR
ncbi:MAG: RluA family pseudouridine synthase [Pseudomonadota bacterium]